MSGGLERFVWLVNSPTIPIVLRLLTFSRSGPTPENPPNDFEPYPPNGNR